MDLKRDTLQIIRRSSGSDHNLVIDNFKLNLRIGRVRQKEKVKDDANKVQGEDMRRIYKDELERNLQIQKQTT